jgi:serine/threonine-protein kinase
MTPLFCSKGHENPAGTRFCQQCGEKLNIPMSYHLTQGLILGDRYRIVRELGHGGFGRTYLAEDLNRFNEACVLKEFAPQVQGSYALQKASELFEREAGVLYKLQHPQIPRFREMFRVQQESNGRLFLVQDYVEGYTYRELLNSRLRQGLKFNEVEATQLLLQLLPVLEYIHGLGVIHRDISPDNLMLRSSDGLPVLIDFGGVKEVAATVASQFIQPGAGGTPPIPTRLGKMGYAPEEQMLRGSVYPHSDLYALAATILVLLTGKEPQQLIDPQTLAWNWRQYVSLSPKLASILEQMLQSRPGDRYQSAREVLQALTSNHPPAPQIPQTIPPSFPPPQPATEATVAVAPPPIPRPPRTVEPATTPAATPPSQPAQRSLGLVGWILIVSFLITVAGVIGWAVGLLWLKHQSIQGNNVETPSTVVTPPQPDEQPTVSPSVDPPKVPSSELSDQERQRQAALEQRRSQLGVSEDFYVRWVNDVFWTENPSQRGRALSNDAKDESLRSQRDKIATQLLDQLEQANLSREARRRLGRYDATDRQRWKNTVNKQHLSSRALNDLTDAKYSFFFPSYSAKKLNLSFDEFLTKPMGQVWHAIAADKVTAITSEEAVEKIRFDVGAVSQQVNGKLKPGEGKAYIAQLSADQIMQLQLQAESAFWSVYPPTSDRPPLLEDSSQKSWSGKLSQSGFYEFVIVSTSSKPLDYQLTLTVENPTPAPVSTTPEPSPDVSESPSPSP